MASNQKSESGTNCWLTGPVKSLAALSNEGKPSSFEISNMSKTMDVFSLCTYEDFLSKNDFVLSFKN